MTEKSVLEQITDIVIWYHGIGRGYNGVTNLQDGARKLATLIFFHATDVAELYADKNRTQYVRETKRDKKKTDLMGSGSSAYAADPIAREFVSLYLKEEQEADSAYQKAKILHDSAREVLNAIQQQISNLKAERNIEMRGALVQQT